MLAGAEGRRGDLGRPGAETFWGGYSGIFLDPDGHPWEVAHSSHWSFRESGAASL